CSPRGERSTVAPESSPHAAIAHAEGARIGRRLAERSPNLPHSRTRISYRRFFAFFAGVSSFLTSGSSEPFPTATISFCGTPFAVSSFTITAARFCESSLLCEAEPEVSVWPLTSNLKFCTWAALRRFLASTSALARLRIFLSHPLSTTSVSDLKLHWFLRDSARSRWLIWPSSFAVVAFP